MEYRLSSEYSSLILLNRMSERLFCKEALWGKTSELLNKTVHLTLTPGLLAGSFGQLPALTDRPGSAMKVIPF